VVEPIELAQILDLPAGFGQPGELRKSAAYRGFEGTV
jgi:hypothetical protein